MDSNDSEATEGQATATFATTAFTKAHNTVKVDPAVLATSNGHSGKERERLAGTSHGSITGGAESRYGLVSSAVVLMSTLAGACLMLNGLWR
ncbi:hypothetical protein DFP72DRAFT_917475 [Ephemerocybe angulata]|uniref:Uncharacterized protein n=1 Tax=Ephemerocybe angulata TaxID=980116 RepID=A0A8H6HKT8_9AGAR|nr:hypothetical protein DFP72DRAFT_917475 [Tulosesus angulatus]